MGVLTGPDGDPQDGYYVDDADLNLDPGESTDCNLGFVVPSESKKFTMSVTLDPQHVAVFVGSLPA